MANMYPALGRPLTLATYSGSAPPLVAQPLNATIANGALSDCEPIADALAVQLVVRYASAPGSTTAVQLSPDNTFASTVALTPIPASAETTAFYTITQSYNGFIRISNTSGVSITSIFVQKRDTTT